MAGDASLSLTRSSVTHNRAVGGSGNRSRDGDGVGGVFSLGTLLIDGFSVIKKNRAKTGIDGLYD